MQANNTHRVYKAGAEHSSKLARNSKHYCLAGRQQPATVCVVCLNCPVAGCPLSLTSIKPQFSRFLNLMGPLLCFFLPSSSGGRAVTDCPEGFTMNLKAVQPPRARLLARMAPFNCPGCFLPCRQGEEDICVQPDRLARHSTETCDRAESAVLIRHVACNLQDKGQANQSI